jgi:hypothetical protein
MRTTVGGVAGVVLVAVVLGAAGARADEAGDPASRDRGDDASERAPHVIQVGAHGHSSSFCGATTFSICSSQTEMAAREDGARNTAFQCRLEGGRLDSEPLCSSFCSPIVMPPVTAGPTQVNCDATCYASCSVSP